MWMVEYWLPASYQVDPWMRGEWTQLPGHSALCYNAALALARREHRIGGWITRLVNWQTGEVKDPLLALVPF